MPYVNYVRGSLSKLPEEIVDGSIYYLRNGGIYTDQGTTRVHHNPPADWNATDRNSPAYIDNKPELGSVSSHDVLDSETDLNQTSDIPTSKHVYKSVYALTVEVETLKGALGRPEVVDGVADMTDTKKAYVYVGEEEGMNKGHWYYFDAIEEEWTDGGSYFTGVETDVTLTRGGISADAAAVGNRLTELMGQIEEMLKTQNVLTAFVDSQEVLNESFADDLEVTEEGLVYILNNGTRIGGPYGPFAGNGSGGGGGGGGDIIDAKFNATKISDWATKTISDSGDASFEFTWESLENDLPSGRGTVTITVNNIVKGTISVNQGDISLSLKPYLSSGANKIRIRIADQYDQGKIWTVNVEVISLKIESLFDTSFPFTEAINFTYTPYGAVTKTVHFSLDGTEIGTTTTPVTGHQLSYAIPKQSHGSHTLDVYFEAEINGEQVTSNTLHYEFISLDENGTRTIISSSFTTTSVDQYTSVVIPFVVYTPKSLESIVELYANDVLVSSQTVDRSQHSYTYKANTPGQIEFKIVSGEETRILTFTVNESDINVEAETDALALYLFAEGRSNGEDASQRSVWKYNDIEAQLTGFSWNMLDGWQKGEDNATVLRLVRDARVVIPYKLFGTDFKSTGKTIEIEFETNNVIDYSVPIISCKQDGVGLEITPQTVTFNGAQTELMTPFKENEHIRLSIVVEKQTEYRLLYFYINGIMSSAIQYASGERFTQLQPVDITIGSNLCGLDIYSIRVYDNNLTRQQIVNNWIADTTDGTLMLERYNHNDIYDAYGDISPSTLPIDLPYFIIYADEMPQYKGDKKTVYGSYTDPSNPSQSFEFEGCQANVQGTSSEGYFRKNYDLQFKKGFDFTSGHKDKISIISAKPFNRFVLKADVASSESANNTLLCMFYNDTCPYKIPEMIQDPQIRWGIEGKPAVLFWNDTKTGTLNFLSKVNFNYPKRSPDSLGYSGNDESWEVERNNSANVLFQDNDFVSTVFDDETQSTKPAWYDDWEARMPSDEWRDYNKLNEFIAWVKSTWRDACTNEALSEPINYTLPNDAILTRYPDDDSYTAVEETVTDGEGNTTKTGKVFVTFTKDTPAYRLAKFRVEASQYMEIQSATFYYIFTVFFLLVDSWAKNMFMGFHGSPTTGLQYMDRKVVFEPYDMDTGLGTNNSGVLKFGFYHLDTDKVSSIIAGSDSGSSEANVFNGQESVLWSNFRDAFRAEYRSMYSDLRASGAWTYQNIEQLFENHQAKWPEALFNEDAYYKYLYPLMNAVTVDEETGQLIKTDRYLTMLQGSKQLQRKWWLYNRFRYFDSMYITGNAATSRITMRIFNSGTITLTPAIDHFATVRFGGGTTALSTRATGGTPVSFSYNAPTVTDLETWIYSADLLSDVGDLSGFYPNELDFSRATRLRKLKIGDATEGYSNANLVTINVQNCYQLEEIDVRNCPELKTTVNLEGSVMLEKAYFDGTSVTGVDIADGAPLEILHLPSTITTLTMLNLTKLEEFVCPSIANVTRLMVSNVNPDVFDAITELAQLKPNSQVNIQGIQLEMDTAEEIEDFLDTLDTMSGVSREMGSNGEWLYQDHETAQVSGTIHIYSLTGEQIASYNSRYPYLRIVADHYSSKITFNTWDGSSVIQTINCEDGVMLEDAPTVPARISTAQYDYTPVGWSMNMDSQANYAPALQNIEADRNVYAAYSRTVRSYTVTWKNGNTVLATETYQYGATPSYKGSTPTSEGYASIGWNEEIVTVTGPATYTAKYKPVYDVIFKLATEDGGTQLQSKRVQEGLKATYTGSTPTTTQGNTTDFTFIGWNYDLNVPITKNTTILAVFRDNRSVVLKYMLNSTTEYVSDSTFDNNYIRPYAFYGRNKMTTVDITGPSPVTIGANAFNGCSKLAHLILRCKVICTLENVNAFTNTLIGVGGGVIYVPNNLLLAYKNDANWKNYVIMPIGEYPYDPIGVQWEEVINNTTTYATDYAIGKTLPVIYNGVKYQMELIAKDTDDKADGSGKARMTWMAKTCFGNHNMNSSDTNSNGWPNTVMRSWLRSDVWNQLPEVLRNNIVEVNKTYYDYTSKTTKTSVDTIWIPSNREMYGPSGGNSSYIVESSGVDYTTKFNNNSVRIKQNGGSAVYWWIRSAYSSYKSSFLAINIVGSIDALNASSSYGVVPCFCI